MKHRALLKKILAFTLAAMIGLSALSGVIMAFAAEAYDYDYALEVTGDSTIYVPAGDDFFLTVLEDSLTHVTLEFEDAATFSVQPDSKKALWLGWDAEYNSPIEAQSELHHVNFDVINFTFSPVFENEGTMTITTPNPYLYRLEGDRLTAVPTTYTEGVHHFQTAVLGCFLAANEPIKL